MLKEHQKRWGVDQWAAYLTAQDVPCMPRSKLLLLGLEEAKGDALAAEELADIVMTDPFLCLKLLREAEKRRTRRLGHDTTTPLAAVMQLGVTTFRDLVLESTETDESLLGLAACESRAVMASKLARLWGRARSDIAPDEVAMAALLAEIGELLLWHFIKELPEAAQMALEQGRASRSALAQEITCGFRFRDLSLKCAIAWALPPLLIQLIRGADNVRANLCKLYLDTARHLVSSADNPALPDDLAQARRLIPQASLEWLAEHMIGLDTSRQALVIQSAQAILAQSGKPA